MPFWEAKADGRTLPLLTLALKRPVRPPELNLPNTMPPGLSYVTWQMMTRKSTLQDAFPPDESMSEEQNITAEVDTVYMSVMEQEGRVQRV